MRRLLALLAALTWLPLASCDARMIVETCTDLDSIVVDSAGTKIVVWKTPC